MNTIVRSPVDGNAPTSTVTYVLPASLPLATTLPALVDTDPTSRSTEPAGSVMFTVTLKAPAVVLVAASTVAVYVTVSPASNLCPLGVATRLISYTGSSTETDTDLVDDATTQSRVNCSPSKSPSTSAISSSTTATTRTVTVSLPALLPAFRNTPTFRVAVSSSESLFVSDNVNGVPTGTPEMSAAWS